MLKSEKGFVELNNSKNGNLKKKNGDYYSYGLSYDISDENVKKKKKQKK